MNSPRPVDLARLGLGAAALAKPDLFLHLGAHDGRGVSGTVRILGGRYIVQSAGRIIVRHAWDRDADAAVDLLHAATMLALAAVVPSHRRPALLSAVTATGFATADLREKAREDRVR